MDDVRPSVSVTEIGEYIRHSCCERRFRLGFNNRELARRLPFAERLFNPLDPVLQEVGRQREAEWERSLRDGAGFADLSGYDTRQADSKGMPWDELKTALAGLPAGQEAYAREVEVSGQISAFTVRGRVDFVVVIWRDGQPFLRLVECKASRRDRTYHRVQVALYRILVTELLIAEEVIVGGIRLTPNDLECVVARIDESTNEGQAILALEPLDLEVVLADAERLLAPEGPLTRILATELDDLSYQLESKCDGCVFNVHCLPESARQRRLELLGLDPSTCRALRSASVTTIDDLAELDLTSQVAADVRSMPGFSGSLDILVLKARARRVTLPRGDAGPDGYMVAQLPGRWESQLPLHEVGGRRLVRVYLAVDYDYTENRIGALSAHITTSAGLLHTGFGQVNGRRRPMPGILEHVPAEEHGQPMEQPIQGIEVIRFKTSRWTGRSLEDNSSERELIQSFIHDLIDAIAQVAQAPQAPIHFYLWSRSEMRQLVEGCTRGGSDLLAHLKELLGCRESLEQLIFSCVGEEVDNRFALGWTGRGLSVASSLRWFGSRYHWRRTIGGQVTDLDRVFTQDLFDFKTDLYLDEHGQWAEGPAPGHVRHKFEVRSRFHDSLPAPYWHAVWRTLPNPGRDDLPRNLRNAIERYNEAAQPLCLREYLRARTHALRWVEERIRYKNQDITKPPLDIAALIQFELGVNTTAQAALDFLTLEQHIRAAQWVSSHLVAPTSRVPLGQTLPVRAVRAVNDNLLEAHIDLAGYDIDREELEARSTLAPGAFVRITPCAADPSRPQTVGQLFRGGSTCTIDTLDWLTGRVTLSVIPQRQADHYRLMSISREAGQDVFDHATLDESPSDYVAVRVDARLRAVAGAPAYRWFDPASPRLPEQNALSDEQLQQLAALLSDVHLQNGHQLSEDQQRAVLDGLDTTAQLLQGPPGTGKTQTTAVAVLVRVLNALNSGDILLVAANTHTAVDNLLSRIVEVQEAVAAAAQAHGLQLPQVTVVKVHSGEIETPLDPPVQNFRARACAREIRSARRDTVVVLGGTTSALLKMAGSLSGTAQFPHGFRANALIVDEASMMVFPYFLALVTLLEQDGRIMLSGDHRQLAPILAHDWEREDRPPVVLYQPFVSAYDALRSLAEHPTVTPRAVRRSALEYTFRLPPVVRSLIAQLYRRDDIELRGTEDHRSLGRATPGSPWGVVWGGAGLFLIVHDERESRQSNLLEAQVIRLILDSGGELGEDTVAIVTPHRAQRTLLRRELADFEHAARIIDTVERLQGGQRPTVILSATASDPAAITANVEFILDLNRSNVAFSRVQQRLIVVCSEALLNHIAPELEHYESAMLWKSLRSLCRQQVATACIDGHSVTVYTPDGAALGDVRLGG